MRHVPALVAAVTGSALLAGCSSPSSGSDLEGATVGTLPATPEATAGPAEDGAGAATTAASEPDGTSAPAQGNPASYDGELRDGVWQVGDAGEVEFAVVDGALELVDVRPAEGWQVTDQQAAPDEIEVDLRQGAVEYEVEIEIEAGLLEIEIDQDVDPAEPGTYRVGDAALVELDVVDGALVLGGVTVSDGWTETDRSESPDEVELDLQRGAETWELDVDLDDGVMEVEIDYEIEGPFPG
ncbi:hypothetical protein [Aquipuribacter sp. MA13-6]|uniref:hypothetical protein n=1 Tax=unclassified Aquipuribacter TaxID=2635084 RepID=UPI003EED60C6